MAGHLGQGHVTQPHTQQPRSHVDEQPHAQLQTVPTDVQMLEMFEAGEEVLLDLVDVARVHSERAQLPVVPDDALVQRPSHVAASQLQHLQHTVG